MQPEWPAPSATCWVDRSVTTIPDRRVQGRRSSDTAPRQLHGPTHRSAAGTYPFDSEGSTDEQVTVVEHGGDSPEGIPEAAVVGKAPALSQFARHPVQTDVLVIAILFVGAVHQPRCR